MLRPSSPSGDALAGGPGEVDLVLVGGGHAHVQTLARLAETALEGVRLTLVVDRPIAVYSGMVPGFVAGQYERRELEIDVEPLARRAGARLVVSAMTGIDPKARRIEVDEGPPVPYDLASFDVGSTVAGLELPGVREHALPTRPIGRFVARVDDLIERAKAERGQGVYRVVVVGGGAGGVELAFTLRERLLASGLERVEVRLVESGPRVLAGYPDSLVRRVERQAAARDIEIVHGRRVARVKNDAVELDDGGTLAADTVVWVAGAASHGIFEGSGLATDDRGFLLVRPTLQVVGHDELFACGDCATLAEHPKTPKAGVYAVRQGPYVTENLLARLAGERMREYTPQGDFLTLLNLGDGTALGAKWGWSFEGRWVMRLKDWIDRRFVRRFQVDSPAATAGQASARGA